VADKRLTQRGDRGILTLALEVRNGQGEVLQDGTNLLMVRTRASGS
jgi:acyl dehydratase